jgi:hypothetical protein
VNLDREVGPAWTVYCEGPDISLFPSIWLETECHCHFIVWRSRLYVFSTSRARGIPSTALPISEELIDNIMQVLPGKGLVQFTDVAEALDVVPWDVLEACNILVKRGVITRGKGSKENFFGRR